MKSLFTCFLFFLFCIALQAETYQIGHISQNYTDSHRNNRNISVEYFYPSTAGGDQSACAQPVKDSYFPMIIFAPAENQNSSNYTYLTNYFVGLGYVFCYINFNEVLPDAIRNYALDMEFLLRKSADISRNVSTAQDSIFKDKITEQSCLMGYDLGAKAAYLATKEADTLLSYRNISGLVSFANSDFDTLTAQAAYNMSMPHLIFSGSLDSCAPVIADQQPLYTTSTSIIKTLVNITNGTHCNFADSSALCLAGDTKSPLANAITADSQHVVVKTILNDWMDFILKDICQAGPLFEQDIRSSSVVSAQNKNMIPSFNISKTGTDAFCHGDSVIYDVETDAVYVQWSDGSPYRRRIFKDSTAQTVKVWNYPACYRESDSIKVIIYDSLAKPQIHANGDLTFCEGDSVELYLTGNYNNILWSTGETTPNIAVKSQQKISVTVSNANGCQSASDTVQVNVISAAAKPVLSYSNKSLCKGDSLVISCSNTYPHYIWSTGDTTNSVTIEQSGQYWLTVSNGYCSITSDTLNLVFNSIPAKPLFEYPKNISFCQDDSTIIHYSGSATKLQWSNGSTGTDLIIKAGGKYFLTVYNEYGCAKTSDTINVTVNPLPDKPHLMLIGKTIICPQSSSSYKWYRFDQLISGANDSTYIPEYDGSYSVIVTNEYGCSICSDTVTLSLGVDDQSIELAPFTINPIPFDNHLHITPNMTAILPVYVEILDLQGKELFKNTYTTEPIDINTDSFAKGIYFLQITYSGKIYHFKIVK